MTWTIFSPRPPDPTEPDLIPSEQTVLARGHRLDAGRPLVVGVVNATPDSFSDSGDRSTEAAIAKAERHLADGASIVEIGGESNVTNRPAVGPGEEIDRVMPVVEAAVAAGGVVSIDTYKPEVAAACLEAGAAIVNDISGSGRAEMIRLCAGYGAGMVLMHTEVAPKQQRWDEELYPDGVTERQLEFFGERIARLGELGVAPERIVIDPGPDFAKTPRQTIESLRGLPRLAGLGRPIMLAVSRKDFIGALTGRPPSRRGAGTLAALAAGIELGGRLLRVHDVAATVDFLAVWEALRGPAEVPAGLRIDERVRREAPAAGNRRG